MRNVGDDVPYRGAKNDIAAPEILGAMPGASPRPTLLPIKHIPLAKIQITPKPHIMSEANNKHIGRGVTPAYIILKAWYEAKNHRQAVISLCFFHFPEK